MLWSVTGKRILCSAVSYERRQRGTCNWMLLIDVVPIMERTQANHLYLSAVYILGPSNIQALRIDNKYWSFLLEIFKYQLFVAALGFSASNSQVHNVLEYLQKGLDMGLSHSTFKRTMCWLSQPSQEPYGHLTSWWCNSQGGNETETAKRTLSRAESSSDLGLSLLQKVFS